jgi:hypothetical protein
MKISCKTIISSITIAFSLCFVQCKKETAADNSLGLPNATQTGANIFAAELTGIGIEDSSTYTTNISFVADNDLNNPFYSSSGNGAWLNNDTLLIAGAPPIGSYFKGIQFTIIGNLKQGNVYNIDSVTTIAVTSTDSICNGVSMEPTVSISDSGTIQLTRFDTVNKIVSGTFTCNFPFPQCGDSTVYATQGRFDYKYH